MSDILVSTRPYIIGGMNTSFIVPVSTGVSGQVFHFSDNFGAVGNVSSANITLDAGSTTSNRGIVGAVLTSIGTDTFSMTYNNVAMTQVSTGASGTAGGIVFFGLSDGGTVASGANSLGVVRVVGSGSLYLMGVSFSGVDQTGGTTSFPFGNRLTGTSTLPNVTITGTGANEFAVAAHQQASGGAWTGVFSGSKIYDSIALTLNTAANYQAGPNPTLSYEMSASADWLSVGVGVKAA